MAEAVVIGAGVVGLACAIEFQRRGYHVVLVDEAKPGRACSFGNAGIIATSEVLPIISPKHMCNLPRMLLSRHAPVSIRPSAFPELATWLWRAVRTLRAERQREIITGLAALNRLALPAWRTLLNDCGAQNLLIERGMLRLIRADRDRRSLELHRRSLGDLGISADLLSAGEVHELEVNLDSTVVGGLLHPGDAHVSDPLEVSLALLDRFTGAGGTIVEDRVLCVIPGEAGATAILRDGSLKADRVIVAAGLASGALMAPLGVRAPLQAERGYHLMLRGGGNLTSRPVTFQAESCVATPMGDRLRLAGTVEFAAPASSPTWSRAYRLAPIAQRYFPASLPTLDAEKWVGSRPSLPDSLPAIGQLKAVPAIGYAFGHQHLGLTLAAVSAVLLGAKMHGEPSDIDLRPYDIARFA